MPAVQHFAFQRLQVLFNIAGPAKNQLDSMDKGKKGVAAGLGLCAASLLAAQNAEAAQQVADPDHCYGATKHETTGPMGAMLSTPSVTR